MKNYSKYISISVVNFTILNLSNYAFSEGGMPFNKHSNEFIQNYSRIKLGFEKHNINDSQNIISNNSKSNEIVSNHKDVYYNQAYIKLKGS